MLLIFVIGIGLAKAGMVWQTEVQREREKELLFIGEQYAMAIASYYENTPSGLKQYPASLEDLLQDNRFPVVRRHLRKLYSDPITGGEEWGLIKEQGRITGVYSLSRAQPLKQAGFPDKFADFSKAGNYQDWQFNYSGGSSVGSGAESPATASVPDSLPQQADSPAPDAPPSPSGSKSSYAVCEAERSAENMQCRISCGNPSGQLCRTCFTASFDHYRSCLHGG